MRRRALLAALGTGVVGLTAGCSSVLADDEPACQGDACDVDMNRMAYAPETYEVGVGETVTWKNTSSAAHTVTAYEDATPEAAEFFATGGYEDEATARDQWHETRGGAIGPRETFEHTFDVAGRYQYFCVPHERGGMIGEIVVSG
jgi:plastocyanin